MVEKPLQPAVQSKWTGEECIWDSLAQHRRYAGEGQIASQSSLGQILEEVDVVFVEVFEFVKHSVSDAMHTQHFEKLTIPLLEVAAFVEKTTFREFARLSHRDGVAGFVNSRPKRDRVGLTLLFLCLGSDFWLSADFLVEMM